MLQRVSGQVIKINKMSSPTNNSTMEENFKKLTDFMGKLAVDQRATKETNERLERHLTRLTDVVFVLAQKDATAQSLVGMMGEPSGAENAPPQEQSPPSPGQAAGSQVGHAEVPAQDVPTSPPREIRTKVTGTLGYRPEVCPDGFTDQDYTRAMKDMVIPVFDGSVPYEIFKQSFYRYLRMARIPTVYQAEYLLRAMAKGSTVAKAFERAAKNEGAENWELHRVMQRADEYFAKDAPKAADLITKLSSMRQFQAEELEVWYGRVQQAVAAIKAAKGWEGSEEMARDLGKNILQAGLRDPVLREKVKQQFLFRPSAGSLWEMLADIKRVKTELVDGAVGVQAAGENPVPAMYARYETGYGRGNPSYSQQRPRPPQQPANHPQQHPHYPQQEDRRPQGNVNDRLARMEERMDQLLQLISNQQSTDGTGATQQGSQGPSGAGRGRGHPSGTGRGGGHSRGGYSGASSNSGNQSGNGMGRQ